MYVLTLHASTVLELPASCDAGASATQINRKTGIALGERDRRPGAKVFEVFEVFEVLGRKGRLNRLHSSWAWLGRGTSARGDINSSRKYLK